MTKKETQKLGTEGAGGNAGRDVTDRHAGTGAKDSGDGEELKNVTVTMLVEVARWARIRAAEEGSSLARFLGDVLLEKMNRESTYETAMMRYLSRTPQELRRDGGEIPRREDLH